MVARGNNITSVIEFNGNRRVEKVLDWLYKDSTIYLERKYNKYLELKLRPFKRIYKIDKTVDIAA